MEAVFLIGRILFSAIFVMSGLSHLTQTGPMAQYAASKGVPAPKLGVLASGVVILAGGLSILLGYEPRIGAILIVLFLVPTALIMHGFWGVQDPMQKQVEMAMFMKNISLAGGALMIYYFTALHPEAWVYSVAR
jgi:putative oxidoreductase